MCKKHRVILFLITIAFAICVSVSCANSDDEPEERGIPVTSEMDIMVEETLEAPQEETIPQEEPPEITYVLNTNSRRFHKPFCRSVELMKPENYQETSASREEVLEMGYKPCGNCKL